MLHKSIVPSDRHAPWSWEFADTAARTGATGFVASDIGKVALQQDNHTAWILTSTAPAWAPLGSAATVSWADVAGKPSTFPPSTHTHEAGDLSGVVKSVNGVAPDGSGNVTVSDGGGGGAATILQATGTLAQGQSLTITHAADASRARLITLVKTITTVTPGANVVPAMTSNTTPSGVASASGQYDTSFAAWAAFDRSNGTQWGVSGAPAWLAYQFPSAQTLGGYTIRARSSYGDSGPRDWQFQGSADGSTWTTIDTRSGVTWTDGQERTFTLSAPATYSRFRLNVTAGNTTGYAVNLSVCELGLLAVGSTTVTYESPSNSDYKVTYTDTTTVLTRTAAGTETVTMNLLHVSACQPRDRRSDARSGRPGRSR